MPRKPYALHFAEDDQRARWEAEAERRGMKLAPFVRACVEHEISDGGWEEASAPAEVRIVEAGATTTTITRLGLERLAESMGYRITPMPSSALLEAAARGAKPFKGPDFKKGKGNK
jgi:hypothetical protein